MAKRQILKTDKLDFTFPKKEDVKFGPVGLGFLDQQKPRLDSLVAAITRVQNILKSMTEVNPNIHPVKYTTLNTWRLDLAATVESLINIAELMRLDLKNIKEEDTNIQQQS